MVEQRLFDVQDRRLAGKPPRAHIRDRHASDDQQVAKIRKRTAAPAGRPISVRFEAIHR